MEKKPFQTNNSRRYESYSDFEVLVVSPRLPPRLILLLSLCLFVLLAFCSLHADWPERASLYSGNLYQFLHSRLAAALAPMIILLLFAVWNAGVPFKITVIGEEITVYPALGRPQRYSSEQISRYETWQEKEDGNKKSRGKNIAAWPNGKYMTVWSGGKKIFRIGSNWNNAILLEDYLWKKGIEHNTNER